MHFFLSVALTILKTNDTEWKKLVSSKSNNQRVAGHVRHMSDLFTWLFPLLGIIDRLYQALVGIAFVLTKA